METILGLCIGVGLSAACGFRVFVPLLVMSIATMMGWFEPSKGFEWLAMPSVCLALAVATVGEMSQFAGWAAAIIVGGGTAGVVQMSTVAARGVSTATTGGLGNFVVATGEWIGAILLSVSALLVPALVAIVVIIAVILAIRWIQKKKQEQAHSPL